MTTTTTQTTTMKQNARRPAPSMSEQATRLIALITNPALDAPTSVAVAAALRPRDEDYDALFAPGAAARARRRYANLWRKPVSFRRKRADGRLFVTVASGRELAACAEPARYFPREYLGCGDVLRRDAVWATWFFDDEGKPGTRLDGLVHTGSRWVWAPRPWLFLDPRADQAEVQAHWGA